MSMDSFILAFCRFKARRGHPKSIRRDNGSNFVGAKRELKDTLSTLDQKKITNKLNEIRVQGMFNPPKSPSIDEGMEALIKIAKEYLKVLVENRLLHEDALHTLSLETESIVNSRPLTSLSDDIDDLEPLTLNHFLIGRSSPNTNFANITEKNVNSRTKWKLVQAVTSMYWKHWIKEYLPLLILRNKWTKHRGNSTALTCGSFSKKTSKKKHLYRHDKNYYYFSKSNIPVINLIVEI